MIENEELSPFPPVPTPQSQFEQQMQQGEYLGILESYAVKWTLEKVARDTLQNFYDVNETLDGIKTEIIEDTTGLSPSYTVHIEGGGSYDFRELVHLGATSKEDTTTKAGGFGEGAKIAALILLRDYHFSQVKYGSGGWELSFYLDKPPEGSYHREVRGLWAKLKQLPQKQGSYVEFTSTTTSKEEAQTFLKARELFYSSENLDFQNPDYLSPSGVGIKLLNPGEKGHLYDAGQRRHFLDESKGWENVEGLHIWTKQKTFAGDRDRGAVPRDSLENKVIKPLVTEMQNEELLTLIQKMEPFWPVGTSNFYEPVGQLLREAVAKLAKSQVKITFDEKYVAYSLSLPWEIKKNLEKAGYIICQPYLHEIGMKSSQQKFLEMQQHYKTEPSEKEKTRMEILYQSVEAIKQSLLNEKGQKITSKEIWVYSKDNEKSIVQGQYDENFVWMSQEILNESFPKAFTIYLHELDHKYGNDYSANFSYALTDTLELVIDALEKNPEIFRSLKLAWEKQAAIPPPTPSG